MEQETLLLELAKIPGVYVPSFYDVAYLPDGRIESVTPNRPAFGTHNESHRQKHGRLRTAEKFCRSMVGTVQDRACVEVLRG